MWKPWIKINSCCPPLSPLPLLPLTPRETSQASVCVSTPVAVYHLRLITLCNMQKQHWLHFSTLLPPSLPPSLLLLLCPTGKQHVKMQSCQWVMFGAIVKFDSCEGSFSHMQMLRRRKLCRGRGRGERVGVWLHGDNLGRRCCCLCCCCAVWGMESGREVEADANV